MTLEIFNGIGKSLRESRKRSVARYFYSEKAVSDSSIARNDESGAG